MHKLFIRFSYSVLQKIVCNMANSEKILLAEKHIFSIERQISTLNAEVQSLKKLVEELKHGPCSSLPANEAKKRKLSTKFIDLPDNSLNLNKDENNFSTDNNGFVQVYTDGACENNGRHNAKAGLGVWFGPNHPLNLSEPVRRRATNNVGEIEACTRAIQIVHAVGVKKICINTDSEFVINCITKWMPGWKKKNWIKSNGEPVINKDELLELAENINLMDAVKWNHVRGHRGVVGNEGADALAKEGALKYIKPQ